MYRPDAYQYSVHLTSTTLLPFEISTFFPLPYVHANPFLLLGPNFKLSFFQTFPQSITQRLQSHQSSKYRVLTFIYLFVLHVPGTVCVVRQHMYAYHIPVHINTCIPDYFLPTTTCPESTASLPNILSKAVSPIAAFKHSIKFFPRPSSYKIRRGNFPFEFLVFSALPTLARR